jgi:hypothetical protein
MLTLRPRERNSLGLERTRHRLFYQAVFDERGVYVYPR